MKQLNFRAFNTTSKKFIVTEFFFEKKEKERSKNSSKQANIILFSISRSFRPFFDNSLLFLKIFNSKITKDPEDYQRCPKMSKGNRRFPRRNRNFSNFLNTKPHSGPPIDVSGDVKPPSLCDHLVISTRILWPNGGRTKGVPLYYFTNNASH